MSTTILNGYRIVGAPGAPGAPGAGRPDAFAVAAAFRAAVEPVRRAAYVHLLSTLATLRVDEARHPKPTPADTPDGTPAGADTQLPRTGDGSAETKRRPRRPRARSRIGIPVFDVDAEIEDAAREIEATGRRNPEYDLQCELAFLTDPDDPDSLYALIYTERGDYRETWAAIPGVEDFRYWNCEDNLPDGVTDDEWDHRRAVWDRVLGRSTPAKRGLTWTLVSRYDRLNPVEVKDEVAAAIPSIEDRVKDLAYWRVPIAEAEDGAIVMRDHDTIVAERATLRAELEPQLEPVTVEHLYEHLPAEDRETGAPA